MQPTTTTATTRNGVDAEALFATIGAVRDDRELARFQFRATNRWVLGTHSRSTMNGYAGAGGEHARGRDFSFDGDHPAVLCGTDMGPAPVEALLHAIAACLTAGIANVAAARKVTLRTVESTVEGDIDLQGILGLNDDVRNGYQQMRVTFRIEADAPPETVRDIVARSQARSAVFDVLTNGVPVSVDVETA